LIEERVPLQSFQSAISSEITVPQKTGTDRSIAASQIFFDLVIYVPPTGPSLAVGAGLLEVSPSITLTVIDSDDHMRLLHNWNDQAPKFLKLSTSSTPGKRVSRGRGSTFGAVSRW
jgi:hypothetical protein